MQACRKLSAPTWGERGSICGLRQPTTALCPQLPAAAYQLLLMQSTSIPPMATSSLLFAHAWRMAWG